MAVSTKDMRTATRLQAGTSPFVLADKREVIFYANLNNNGTSGSVVDNGPRRVRIYVDAQQPADRGGHEARRHLGAAGVHLQRHADPALRRPLRRQRRERSRSSGTTTPNGTELTADAAVGDATGSRWTRCRSRSSIRRSTHVPDREHDAREHRAAPERRLPADVGRMMTAPRRARSTAGAPGEQGFALITVLLALDRAAGAVGGRGRVRRRARRRSPGGTRTGTPSLSAAEAGIDDFVFRLNENSNYFQYNATQPAARRQQRVHAVRAGARAATRSRQFRYSTDTSKIAVDGTILITVDRAGRHDEAHGAGDAAPPDVHRLPVLHGLRDARSRAVHRPALHRRHHVHAGAGDDELHDVRVRDAGPRHRVHRDQLHHRRHRSTDRCTRTTRSSSAARRTSTATRRRAGTRRRSPATARTRAAAGTTRCSRTRAIPKYLPNLAMPPSNSAIKAETAAGQGRLPVHRADEHHAQLERHDDGDEPVLEAGERRLREERHRVAADERRRSTCRACRRRRPTRTTRAAARTANPAYPIPALIVTNDANQYACRDGDVFVQGQLKGQLTIASANNIVITGNITYNGGTSGHVAARARREQLRPGAPPGAAADDDLQPGADRANRPRARRRSTGRTTSRTRRASTCSASAPKNLTGAQSSPTINAAILAVNHSFTVPYWQRGATLGTLAVTGAIAQRFRGPVGTNSGGTVVTGYAKNYVYDQRLKYLSPPKFLDPVASAWGVAVWREIKVPAGL